MGWLARQPPLTSQSAGDIAEQTWAVPGAPKQAGNVFDIAQALSWIASHERDFDTVATRQAEIGHILRSFLPAARAL